MLWIEQIFGRVSPLGQGLTIFLGSYVAGCFTTGYYFLRWSTGQDIRQLGSGSVGAKNVWRISGSFGFFVTVLVDFAKGALVVWSVAHINAHEHFTALAFLAVVLGHIWPVQLRFHGGKGVCTSLGALLAYDYPMALVFAGLFACLFALSHRMVLSGLLAFALLPVASIFGGQAGVKALSLAAVACLVLIAHRKNVVDGIAEQMDHRSLEPNSDQSSR